MGTESMKIEELLKQRTACGPVMYCIKTASVNNIWEDVTCKYEDGDIEMLVFMGN